MNDGNLAIRDESQALRKSAERTEALSWLNDAQDDQMMEHLLAPYLNAAAVLATFNLDTLRPAGHTSTLNREEAMIELTDRARLVGKDLWQLEEGARRSALRRLETRAAMRAARAANPPNANDPVQTAIDSLINSSEAPALEKLTLDQLLALERATGWFEQILDSLPSRKKLTARIEKERQLAPMRKLAGQNFVNRETFLARLNDYVGVIRAENLWHSLRRGIKYLAYQLDERPPLHLHGPGGMGKSALLARFILDHADPASPQPLPFVYLDFDRAALDPREPTTLVTDAIRQLLVQFPDLDQELLNLNEEALEHAGHLESFDISRSAQFDSRHDLIRRFCRLLSVIAEQNNQPVLLVLDTLEEAEYQGESAMTVIWDLLRELLSKVDRLRVVTAGRSALPASLPREPLELVGLPPEPAKQLLRGHVSTITGQSMTDGEAASIVSLLEGTVPLSLILASRVVAAEGLQALRDTVRRSTLFAKIKEDQRQGMLYRRILNHVRAHHAELAKVADPGLILRRITSEIIAKVLAVPCDLRLKNDSDASTLFGELAREVGLVDPYREPGALWHLLPVRRIMLPDLRQTLGPMVEQIHASAARYYHDLPNPSVIERAEEIYHRLWLDFDKEQLNQLWRPGMATSLRSAYEELEPRAKIWLAEKLGIELDKALLEQADYVTWERQTLQRAQTLIASGLLAQALTVISERTRPPSPSPLDAQEADVLKLMGRHAEARAVLEKGVANAGQAGDGRALLPLASRLVFLHETMGNFAEALDHASRAFELADMLGEDLDLLSICVAVLRIARKKGENTRFSENARAKAQDLLSRPATRRALPSRPTLLREAAAELGKEDVDLLVTAISQLGISPSTLLALKRLVSESREDLDDSHLIAVDVLDRGDSSRGVGRVIAPLVQAFPAFFAEQLALTVEDSLHRVYTESGRQSSAQMELTPHQMKQLRELMIRFGPDELSMLAWDVFDVHLDEITPRAPLQMQILNLLRYAHQRGALQRLLTALIRSYPYLHQEMAKILGDAMPDVAGGAPFTA